jgi:hypothetical protein
MVKRMHFLLIAAGSCTHTLCTILAQRLRPSCCVQIRRHPYNLHTYIHTCIHVCLHTFPPPYSHTYTHLHVRHRAAASRGRCHAHSHSHSHHRPTTPPLSPGARGEGGTRDARSTSSWLDLVAHSNPSSRPFSGIKAAQLQARWLAHSLSPLLAHARSGKVPNQPGSLWG